MIENETPIHISAGEHRLADYYRTLQVDPQASKEVIEKAYRALSLKYHPDKVAAQTEQENRRASDEWLKIRMAYEVLSDESKRTAYDEARKREMLKVFWSEGLLGLARRYLR
jgi:DnaJ-class molecular chaperone